MDFEVTHTDGRARRGLLRLPHGEVETPAFMPVGTQGAVKCMTPAQLLECGTSMVLANTYHLALRPGSRIVREAGGLHGFMGWKGPILTDSGGFQVFSLSDHNRVTDDGVTFRSYYDGSDVHLTPERSIELQNDLGADVIMAFDECPPYPASREEVLRAVERTTRWAGRSLAAHGNDRQALFGIVQGGVFDELRERSAGEITSLGFSGYAIGGVSVGEPPAEMRRAVTCAASCLPTDSPRYVMGVGLPVDLVDMVGLGVDLFDCVIPTRNGRNATLFTSEGIVRMKNAVHAEDDRPLDPRCACYTCQNFSRAYLRHLYRQRETLAATLGTIHNVAYYQRLVRELREAISHGGYEGFRAAFVASR